MAKPSDPDLPTIDLLDSSWSGASVPGDGRDELTGTTLNGTYLVERVLGEGGMGRVYEARHARIAQKRVAVKVLHAEFARDSASLARFQREGEAAASISHPNVVAVLDVDRTEQGTPYLVCEYLQGIELAEHLKQVGTLKLETAIHVARQLCEGLDAAHARGVIHRDLKPHNVFLVGDFEAGMPARPQAKILDFGLSRVTHADAQLTRTGIIVGTPAYLPPEQAFGRVADERTDVYGVGAILYKALSGLAPYDHPTPEAAIMAVMRGEPPRLRTLAPSVPAQVELVVERAMARDPQQRYADVKTLGRALEQLDGLRLDATAKVNPGERASAVAVEAHEAHAARPRLVAWLLATALVIALASAVSVSGFERARGLQLSRLELGLLIALVLAGFAVPGLPFLHDVFARVWKNTARVVRVTGHLRAGLLAGCAAFGLGVLGLQLVDGVLVRFVRHARLSSLQADWPGWHVVLALVGLEVALVVVLRRKLLVGMPRSWRRDLAGFLLSGLGLALTGGLLYLGLHTRLDWESRATRVVERAPNEAAAKR